MAIRGEGRQEQVRAARAGGVRGRAIVLACSSILAVVLGCGAGGSKGGPGGETADAAVLVPDGGCGVRLGSACVVGAPCKKAADCATQVCTEGTCRSLPASCSDGKKESPETDVDCGGSACPPCALARSCLAGSDCLSLHCAAGECAPPTANDGILDDSETDVDCGGALDADGAANPTSDGAPACGNGKACLLASDCQSGVCPDGTSCAPPTSHDGVKNGGETDIDCGGALDPSGHPLPGSDSAPACAAGKACASGLDCTSDVCAKLVCQAPTPTDGVKNGDETDVDCGGSATPGNDGAAPCAPAKACLVSADCSSFVCTSKICAAPSPNDKVQNGGESDVDCGGATTDGAPRCGDTLRCANDADCLSASCSLLDGTCVVARSCKGLVTPAAIMDPTGQVDAMGDAIGTPDPNGEGQHAGIDTCGKGESTDPLAEQVHESCCRSLLLPGSTTVRLDKYEVTAGRMRQFAESLNPPYGLQQWALAEIAAGSTAGQTLSAQLPGASSPPSVMFLPTSADSVPLNAVEELGGTAVDPSNNEQGCYVGKGAFGASVYFWDAAHEAVVGSPPRPFTRDYYDIKPMNCGFYWVYAAFCAWDGGRMPTLAELQAAYGPAQYPWGANSWPSSYPYETVAVGGLNPNTGQTIRANYQDVPLINQLLQSTGNTAGAVSVTINWLNGSSTNNGGNFYAYPSFVGNDPPGTPDTETNGLDNSPQIAAPGRFSLDVTSAHSTSYGGNEGWRDLGANMMEFTSVTPANVATAGSNTLCDCSGNTAGGGAACVCNATTGSTGVTRGTGLPNTEISGGSWEGHASFDPAKAEFASDTGAWPLQQQYGKIGFRCARPAEPAQ